jgi:ADP-heptose:LPS heptosyltransferase
MNILSLTRNIPLAPDNVLVPGKYLSSDLVAMQLILLAGDGSMEPLKESRPFSQDADWNGKRIMFQRVGGFGDLVLLTPVFREIKRRWPTCHIAISCMAKPYGVVLEGLPFVDELLPFPLLCETAEKYDAWIFYENAIEKNKRAEELHMTELFGEIAGITGIEDLKPEYRIRPTEAIWANEAYPRNSARRITLQAGASGRCRRYPLLGDLLNEIVKKGWEVFLLGAENDIPALRGKKLTPQVRNLTDLGLTFRQSCAVLNTSDCFIGSDSAILHVAGALGIPGVGLYGPFPWKLRTAHSPSITAIQGTGACSPCFHHELGNMDNYFPDHCPSKAKGYCQVLYSIAPHRVIEKAEKIMRTLEPVANVIDFAAKG